MSYLVLARKYRPQTFEEVVGQSHVTTTLKNAIMSDRVAHAILFSGPRGTGKTTVARILAKTINCKANRETPSPTPCNTCRSCIEITSGSAVDVFEIDGASNNNVDQIRDLRDNVRYMPAHSPFKIYIIDEVHMLSIAAFNALLKTLEEPPAHVKFFFATTEPHKIPITILSRCQRHDMRRVDLDKISEHLAKLSTLEGVSVDEQSLALIAQESGGSVRDSLSLLDQVIASSIGDVSHDQVLGILGTVDRKHLFDLTTALLERDIPTMLALIDEIYSRGHDLKKLYTRITEHIRHLLIVKMTRDSGRLVDATSHELEAMKHQAASVSQVYLTRIMDLLFNEEATIRFASQPRYALEMALIKIMQTEPALPIDTLIEKLDKLRDGLPDSGPVPPTSAPPPGGSFSGPGPGSPMRMAEVNESRSGFSPQAQGAPREIPPGPHAEPQASPRPLPEQPANRAPVALYNPSAPLEQTWHTFITWFSTANPSLAPSLSQSALLSVSDQDIQIEIGGSNFNIQRITHDKNKTIITQACREFFRHQGKVTLVPNYDGVNANKKKQEEHQKLKQETLNHPVVSEAIKVFEGTVDITIL